jgi:hypothetical protein
MSCSQKSKISCTMMLPVIEVNDPGWEEDRRIGIYGKKEIQIEAGQSKYF